MPELPAGVLADVNLSAAPMSAVPTSYQAPRVTDLGAWEAVTLIYTVPIGPGSSLFPAGPTWRLGEDLDDLF